MKILWNQLEISTFEKLKIMFNVTSAPQRINFNLKNYNYWSRDNAEANLIMRA